MISMNNNTAVLYDEKWFIIANENKKKEKIYSIDSNGQFQTEISRKIFIYL